MAKPKFCLLVIAIFVLQLSFSFAIPIVKDNHPSDGNEVQDLKKKNLIAPVNQNEDLSSEHYIGKKRNLLTSVADQASSTFSPGTSKTSFISNPATTHSDTTNEHEKTTLHPTNSQRTAFTSEDGKNGISSTTGEGKEVTTTIKGKFTEPATFSPETMKIFTETNFLSPASSSTSKKITKHLLADNSEKVKESPKSQVNDYPDKIQSAQEKLLLPLKDIDSNQGKTVIYSKENTAGIDNLSTALAFPTLPTVTTRNLVPVEVISSQSHESSTLGEYMTGETRINRTAKSSRENGTLNPVAAVNIEAKENNIKILSSQNDAIPLFVQKLLSSSNKSDFEEEISRNKKLGGKENVPSQKVKKESFNETKATTPATERNQNLQNITLIQKNTNQMHLIPLPLSSNQLKNSSNISGSYSVENIMDKEEKSDSYVVTKSTTALVIFGKVKHRQEEPINEKHSTATKKDILSQTNKIVPPEVSSNKNTLEYSTVSTKEEHKDEEGKYNITDKYKIIRLVKDSNENGSLAAAETKNKETIMSEYTRFVLSHYLDIHDSDKDSNNSNFTNPGLFLFNAVHSPKSTNTPGNKSVDPSKIVSSSEQNKPMDLFFLSVFSSWANNYNTGSTENSSKEAIGFIPHKMMNGEFTRGMAAKDGLENGTTFANKSGFQNLARKDKSSMPSITAELTTIVTVNSDVESSTKLANKTELQKLAQKDLRSIPGITDELTTEMTVTYEFENKEKATNKSGFEKLMQEDTSSSPNKDDLPRPKLNHIPLSKNESELSEMLELFNSFHKPSNGVLEQGEYFI